MTESGDSSIDILLPSSFSAGLSKAPCTPTPTLGPTTPTSFPLIPVAGGSAGLLVVVLLLLLFCVLYICCRRKKKVYVTTLSKGQDFVTTRLQFPRQLSRSIFNKRPSESSLQTTSFGIEGVVTSISRPYELLNTTTINEEAENENDQVNTNQESKLDSNDSQLSTSTEAKNETVESLSPESSEPVVTESLLPDSSELTSLLSPKPTHKTPLYVEPPKLITKDETDSEPVASPAVPSATSSVSQAPKPNEHPSTSTSSSTQIEQPATSLSPLKEGQPSTSTSTSPSEQPSTTSSLSPSKPSEVPTSASTSQPTVQVTDTNAEIKPAVIMQEPTSIKK